MDDSRGLFGAQVSVIEEGKTPKDPESISMPPAMAKTTAAVAFDLLVLGAGSGGIAFARRAASYGARVAIVEQSGLGKEPINSI